MMRNMRTRSQKNTATDEKLHSVFEWVSVMIVALVVVTLIFQFLFRMVSVNGNSMMSTLHHGDRLLLTGNYESMQRGDIVVIRCTDGEPLIKRVIAVGGDRLLIDGETGEVHLNGELLDEPYVGGQKTEPYAFAIETVIPDGHIFVMGDNRGGSLDSRLLGTFPLEQVMGKVVFRLLPRPGKL